MAASESGAWRAAAVKTTLGLIAMCIGAYIIGPPLYWQLISASSSFSCPLCSCSCPSSPLVTIPKELGNVSFTDCSKHDPAVSEDTEKNFVELLSEELKLRETEASEERRRADTGLLEAKKVTSQYQKEADKCNSGMETCEEAREKAEAALVAQKKLTAKWEQRARLKGWKEGATKARAQGNVQSE